MKQQAPDDITHIRREFAGQQYYACLKNNPPFLRMLNIREMFCS
jgi:hypothetical protein